MDAACCKTLRVGVGLVPVARGGDGVRREASARCQGGGARGG